MPDSLYLIDEKERARGFLKTIVNEARFFSQMARESRLKSQHSIIPAAVFRHGANAQRFADRRADAMAAARVIKRNFNL